MMTNNLELPGLEQFCGTEHYYKVWLGVNATDGAKYLMDNGYSWLVTDAISVIKIDPKLKNQDFLVIELKLYFQNNVIFLSGEY